MFGWDDNTLLRLIIPSSLTAVKTMPFIAGLDKGCQILSNLSIAMPIGLLIYVLVFGSSLLLHGIVETFGPCVSNLPRPAFWNDAEPVLHPIQPTGRSYKPSAAKRR